jgi:HAE1 family hydrophobic/amphiphilic exporter-1
MTTKTPLLLLAAALLPDALPASAQEPPRVGVGVVERKLTLAEALEMALRSNLEIDIERTGIATAQQSLLAARGAFDGLFRWQPGYESRTTPTASVLFGADGKLSEHFHRQNFSYLQKLPWRGLSLHVDFQNARESTTNPFTALNPYLTSRLVLGFTQPLWRDRETDRDRTEIRIRSRLINVSETDLELRVIDVVTRVEQAYWDLVATRQDVQVKSENVGWAREQLAQNRRMIESGTLAPVELSAAEAELERRVDTYYASLTALTEAENNLKLLIAAGRQDAVWNDVILPVEERTVDFAGAEDLAEAVAQALRRRPELRHIGLRTEVNQMEREFAADQVKPQMNLVGNYINSGLAGAIASIDNPFSSSNVALYQRVNELSARNGLPTITLPSFGSTPGVLVGGYGSTLSGLFGGNYQTFVVGLQVDWSPKNTTAEANLSQTVIAERRLKLQREQSEQAIAAQVRNAMQAIQTARQRIIAAEASARAAKEKLDSETRLFQTGESTNFFVLTRQNEYSDSRRRVVVSRLDFNKAVARLRQAVGTTLETHKLTVR